MTPRLNKTNVAKLIKYIKKNWGVSREVLDLTVGYNPKTKEWDYQSGDNSYSGACYFYPLWGVTTIFPKSKSEDLARDVINQIMDQVEYCEA